MIRRLSYTFNLILALVFPLIGVSQSAQSDGFTVAAILPLSGSSASLGVPIRRALEMAHAKIPPGERSRFRLIFEDDGFDPKRSLAALQKLIQQDKPGALVVVGSAVAAAIGPTAEQNQIPFIAVGASDKGVIAGKQYGFIHWVSPEAESEVLTREIKSRGYRKLALVMAEQQGILAFYRVMLEEFGRQGVKPLVELDQHFIPAENDFRSFLTKAKAKGVDGMVVCLFPDGIISLAKQMKQMSYKADLIGLEWFEDPVVVKGSEGALIGQWYVNADNPEAGFAAEFKEKYGGDSSWGVANAFDSLNLLYRAAIQENKRGKGIVDYLANLRDFRGAAGFYSASGDHRFTLPAAVKVITAQGFEVRR